MPRFLRRYLRAEGRTLRIEDGSAVRRGQRILPCGLPREWVSDSRIGEQMDTHHYAGIVPPTFRPAHLFLGTLLVYLAFLPPGIYSIDGHSMLSVAHSVVLHHNISVPADLGRAGRGGQIYSRWYPLQSFLAVPFVAIGALGAHWLHLPSYYLEAICATILVALCTAATIPLVGLIALELGSTPQGAYIAALSYAFGTIALVYVRSFYAEPLLTFLIAASVYLVLRRDNRSAIPAALAVLAKPPGLLVGPILSAYLLLKRHPFWRSLAPSIGSGVGLLLYCAYNFYRFGNPLTFGHHYPFSSDMLLEGVFGLLVSPGYGVVWYCPCVVLAIVGFMKAPRLEALMLVAIFAVFLVLPAFFFFWGGGWAWGPRYLLPALPGLVALTSLLEGKWRKALIGLAILGFVINAPTLVSFFERYIAEANEQGVTLQQLNWSPAKAPFLHGWPAAMRQCKDASLHDVRVLFSLRGAPSATIASSRALQIVAVWWWVLPVAHLPRWLGIAVATVVSSLGVYFIYLAHRPQQHP